MNTLNEQLWRFARGDSPASQFELWIYNSPELEDFLGSDLYLELISLNFKNEKSVSELRFKLKSWLDKHTTRACDCITWRDDEKIPLGYDTASLLKDFQTLRERTPWLELRQCLKCDTYWYIATDTVDDDYYLVRLNGKDSGKILQEDSWPTRFDNDKRFWPNQEWLEQAGYKSLKDWQEQNNKTENKS